MCSSVVRVRILAGEAIGTTTTLVDMRISDGELLANASADIMLRSVADLLVDQVDSATGDVQMVVHGETSIDQINALAGDVQIVSDDDILDRYSDVGSEVAALTISLQSLVGSVGRYRNELDSESGSS